MTEATPSLERQLACLRREIALRKNVYPAFVARGRMTQQVADDEIAAMTAALHTLMEVAEMREDPHDRG